MSCAAKKGEGPTADFDPVLVLCGILGDQDLEIERQSSEWEWLLGYRRRGGVATLARPPVDGDLHPEDRARRRSQLRKVLGATSPGLLSSFAGISTLLQLRAQRRRRDRPGGSHCSR